MSLPISNEEIEIRASQTNFQTDFIVSIRRIPMSRPVSRKAHGIQ
jgi:hypothetical protein